MDHRFPSKLDEYHQRFLELQEKLKNSEHQRFLLETKFNETVQMAKEEEQAHYRKLRAQYKRFLEEDKKRQDRNERIIRHLERIETRIAMLSAKTERLNMLRKQYQSLLMPDQPQRPLNRDMEEAARPNEETIQILDKYLENMSSERCREVLEHEERARRKLYCQEDEMKSNQAASLADGIMDSICSRHYRKNPPAVRRRTLEEEATCPTAPVKEEAHPKWVVLENNEAVQQPIGGKTESADAMEMLQEITVVGSMENAEIRLEESSDNERLEPSRLELSADALREQKLQGCPENEQPSRAIPGELENFPSRAAALLSEADAQEIEAGINLDGQTKVTYSLDEQQYQPQDPVEEEKQFYQEPLDERALHAAKLDDQQDQTQYSVERVKESCYQENFDARSQPGASLDDQEFQKHGPAEQDKQFQQATLPEPESNLDVQQYQNHDRAGQEKEFLHQEPFEVRSQPGASLDEQQYQNQEPFDQRLHPQANLDEQQYQNHDPVEQEKQFYQEPYEETSGYDEYGQVLLYNQLGQLVQLQCDDAGQIVPHYDAKGLPMMLYDQNGQQYDHNRQPVIQYDSNGQPIYEYYGGEVAEQPYEESRQQEPQYGAAGSSQGGFCVDPGLEGIVHGVSEGHEEYSHQLQEEQGLGDGDTEDSVGGDQGLSSQVQADGLDFEEIEEPGVENDPNILEQVEDEDDQSNVDSQQAEKPKEANVMDILDTDTESSRQNISKVSNDTDFDFN